MEYVAGKTLDLVIPAKGLGTRRGPFDLYAYNPRWTPDGSEIVFSAKSALWRLRIPDGGEPQRLPFVGEDGVSPTVSKSRADGSARLAYIRSYTDCQYLAYRSSISGHTCIDSAPACDLVHAAGRYRAHRFRRPSGDLHIGPLWRV
jgi:hypothetical protein